MPVCYEAALPFPQYKPIPNLMRDQNHRSSSWTLTLCLDAFDSKCLWRILGMTTCTWHAVQDLTEWPPVSMTVCSELPVSACTATCFYPTHPLICPYLQGATLQLAMPRMKSKNRGRQTMKAYVKTQYGISCAWDTHVNASWHTQVLSTTKRTRRMDSAECRPLPRFNKLPTLPLRTFTLNILLNILWLYD